MGVREQNKKQKILLGEDGNALMVLITINVVVFVILKFIEVVFFLGKADITKFGPDILQWVVLTPKLETLAMRPWTVASYMFSHISVWMLFSNMLWLWGFGHIFQDTTGNRNIGPVYIYGGLAGALCFIAAIYLFPMTPHNTGTILLGAGASVMAMAAAVTTLVPKYRIFPMIAGGIPLWAAALLFVIIDFSMAIGTNISLGISHLGGALMGFAYTKRLHSGHDMGRWMHNFSYWIFHLFDPGKDTYKKNVRKELFYESKGLHPYKKTSHVTQQKVDEILDKIGKGGIHMLSEEEKEYLKRASKDL